MKEILHIVVLVFSVFFMIEAVLYLYIKRKEDGLLKWLNKTIKDYLWGYLVFVLLISGWLFFFEDRSLYLECQNDAMTCRYFHTTYFNKEMRLAETYDISRVEYARAHKNRLFGRHTRYYYTVELVEKNKNYGFNLAPEYKDINAAEKEAQRFNRFLSGKEKIYIFRKEPPSESFGATLGSVACLIAVILQIGFLWNLVCAIFKMRKKEKRLQKKKALPQDDIIQRNR